MLLTLFLDPDDPLENIPAFPQLSDGSTLCYSGDVPNQINPLDIYFEVPCDLNDVPALDINPDQRDTLFPVVTPKIDGIRINNTKCTPDSEADVELGTDIGSDSVTDTNVLADSGWDRPGSAGVGVAQRVITQTRMASSTADGIVAFFRTYSYDSCGQLLSISAETKKTVALLGPC